MEALFFFTWPDARIEDSHRESVSVENLRSR